MQIEKGLRGHDCEIRFSSILSLESGLLQFSWEIDLKAYNLERRDIDNSRFLARRYLFIFQESQLSPRFFILLGMFVNIFYWLPFIIPKAFVDHNFQEYENRKKLKSQKGFTTFVCEIFNRILFDVEAFLLFCCNWEGNRNNKIS